MARGRKPIPVTFDGLQEAIVSVEWDGALPSRNALWQAVAATPYARKIGLSSQVAMIKAKGYADEGKPLMLITPLGRKGKLKGEIPVNKEGVKPARKKKTIELPLIAQMKREYPKTCGSKIDLLAKGSRKAAIALKCLECSSFEKKEIALCTIKTCALWNFRPYRGKYKEEA